MDIDSHTSHFLLILESENNRICILITENMPSPLRYERWLHFLDLQLLTRISRCQWRHRQKVEKEWDIKYQCILFIFWDLHL